MRWSGNKNLRQVILRGIVNAKVKIGDQILLSQHGDRDFLIEQYSPASVIRPAEQQCFTVVGLAYLKVCAVGDNGVQLYDPSLFAYPLPHSWTEIDLV